jgi:hypothetical protein
MISNHALYPIIISGKVEKQSLPKHFLYIKIGHRNSSKIFNLPDLGYNKNNFPAPPPHPLKKEPNYSERGYKRTCCLK